MKAPVYFQTTRVEGIRAVDAVEKELSNQKLTPNLATIEELMQKVQYTQQLAISLKEYAWARFRLENWGNAFGKASSLNYNPDKKIITITKK